VDDGKRQRTYGGKRKENTSKKQGNPTPQTEDLQFPVEPRPRSHGSGINDREDTICNFPLPVGMGNDRQLSVGREEKSNGNLPRETGFCRVVQSAVTVDADSS